MTTLFLAMLIAHILLGVVGVGASYTTWMGFLKTKYSLRMLRATSLIAAVSYVLSWLSGGYYYALYYGTNVKPTILAGAYPWAHKFFIEVKEHVFIFLPFLAIVALLAFWSLDDREAPEGSFRKALLWLLGVTTAIGVFVTLSGVVVSGAVR